MMNTIATTASEARAAAREGPAPAALPRLEAFRAWLRLVLPAMAPLGISPLFVAAGVIASEGSDVSTALAILAPALFYSGYAVTIVTRLERVLSRRYARMQAEVIRRVDDFAPDEMRLSRHYFETRLEQEIKRSRRHRLPLCVVTLETPGEHDKAVHTSQLVAMVARNLRAEDCAGRLGRHVYAIYLPHTSPAGAEVVIGRLRDEFRGKQVRFGLSYLAPGRESSAAELLEDARSSAAGDEAA